MVTEDAGVLILQSENGASTSLQIDVTGTWEIWCTSSWLELSQFSGSGPGNVTVTAKESNAELKERITSITVVSSDGSQSVYNVIQRGSEGLCFKSNVFGCHPEADNISITLEGNVTEDDISVCPSAAWIKYTGLKVGDKELVGNLGVPSTYGILEMSFEVEKNETADFKETEIIITVGDKEYSLTAVQMCESDVDFEREFHKNVLVTKFTSTSCIFCPAMERILNGVIEGMPDKIIPLNIHPMSSEGGLGFSEADILTTQFKVNGYPTAFANYVAKINNSKSDDEVRMAFSDITTEVINDYPAATAISAVSKVNNGEIALSVEMAMKDVRSYRLYAYLVEDKIIYKQQDSDEIIVRYEHNHILRSSLSDVCGDPFPYALENGICRLDYSLPLPQNVNVDNSYIILFTTYEGVPDVGNVEYVTYMDFGFIVDNVVKVKLNSEIDFQYEP